MKLNDSNETQEESGREARVQALVVGCGFIGRRMAERIAAAGHQVRVLTRKDPGPELRESPIEVIVGDAADPDVIEKVDPAGHHIIWTAGGLMPLEAEADPEMDRDLTLGPLRVLAETGVLPEVSSLSYFSSGGKIYGNPGPDPVDESHPVMPMGAYGRNKKIAEDFLLDAAAEHDFQLRILRCANVYGQSQRSDRSQGAVAVFQDRIRRGLPIEVFGEDKSFRDYVHVDDVVDATVALWGEGGPAVLNCGSGRPVTIAELIGLLESAVGRPAIVRALPARDVDVDGVVLDITRIRQLIDFQPVELGVGLGLGMGMGSE